MPPPLTTGDDLRARNRRRGHLVYLVSSCIDVFSLVVAAFHVVTVIIRGPRGLRRRSTARRLSLLGYSRGRCTHNDLTPFISGCTSSVAAGIFSSPMYPQRFDSVPFGLSSVAAGIFP